MEAIYNESQKATELAAVEREKAAAALRDGLAQLISSGDAALRDHIANQISQIQAALLSADKLEIERILRLEDEIRAGRLALDKFEGTVTARFTQVNEFRAALDDLGQQMATRRELETALTGVQDAVEKARQERQHQLDDMRSTITEMRSRLDTNSAEAINREALGATADKLQALIDRNSSDLSGLSRRIDLREGETTGSRLTKGALYAALAAGIAVLGLIVVLANYLTHP